MESEGQMLGKRNRKKELEQYEKQVFLFSPLDTLDEVMGIFCEAFGIDPASGSGNTLELHKGDRGIRILVISENMGEEARDCVKDQRDRTRSHFMQVKTEHADVRLNLFYQLGLAKSFIPVSFVQPDDDFAEVEDLLIGLLPRLLGVMLIQDEPGAVYCGGEDGERRLVLTETGASDFDKYLPRTGPLLETLYPDLPEEQRRRRGRSRAVLEAYGIFVPNWYPVIEAEGEAHVRTPEEIARRAFALVSVALYSECLVGDGMSREEAYAFIRPRMAVFGADCEEAGFFSPDEWKYLHDPDSGQQEWINGTWQYECLYVMEWALGLVDSLGFPDHYCDVPLTVRLLKEYDSVEEILAASHPRTAAELLDACDLIFCLDWACVNTRLYQFPAPAGMDGGVTQEWHKSLNWLIGYGDSALWDEVSTDT